MKRLQQGYVALISVLIIGAAATAIALTILAVGADNQRTELVELQSSQARDLAVACAQEALQQLHDNIAFGSTATLSLGQGSCTYRVNVQNTTARNISSVGTVGNVSRAIAVAVTVNATTITSTSWKDISDTATTIAHVQSVGGTSASAGATIAQAYGSSTTAGDLLLATIAWDTTSTSTVSCTDTQGNSFTTVNVWVDATNKQALAFCYAPKVTGGADTITATFGASTANRSIIVSEYSGVTGFSPYDVSTGVGGSTATTGTDAVTSGTATTTQNGELIVGAVLDTAGTSTITAGTGFTQRASVGARLLAIQDLQQSTAGSIASTQTFNTTHRVNVGMITFKPASQ